MRVAALALCAAVVLAGCGGPYADEKKLWKANRLLSQIRRNPAGTPVGLYNKARRLFESVDSVEALLGLGELYALEGNSGQAEAFFGRVAEKFPENVEANARARYAMARLREDQGRWDDALSIYREIVQNYEKVPLAAPIPLYVARRYIKMKDEGRAKASYEEAIAFYRSMEEKYPRSRAALTALELRAFCHAELGQWPAAMDALQTIREQFPGTPEAVRAVRARLGILQSRRQAPIVKNP